MHTEYTRKKKQQQCQCNQLTNQKTKHSKPPPSKNVIRPNPAH